MDTRDTRQALLGAAIALADRGLCVFPISPGRKEPPAITGWQDRATTDRERITRCWAHRPYNIGVATGPSGLVVVDLDIARPGEQPPEGQGMLGELGGVDVLAELARRDRSTVPATFTVDTPSGGRHLYFRAPAGVALGNTQGTRLGWKVDTRARGGYAVGPGSILPAGCYRIADDRPPVPLPGWMTRRLATNPAAGHTGAPTGASDPAAATDRTGPVVDPGRYLSAVLDGQADRVAAAQPGRHNRTLFIAACRLGEFVGAGALDRQHAAAVLRRAAEHMVTGDCDCTDRAVTNTITSGLNTGTTNPRHPAGKPAPRQVA